jgi:nucleotide-binding universal stress UspA family protein
MNANKTVLATTDGSAHSHRVLPHAALLAEALECRVALLEVVEGGEDAVELESALQGTLSRLGIDGAVVAEKADEDEEVAAAILRVARQTDAAVLALDSRGHGALRHVLHGSVLHDLLRGTDRLLLVSGPNVDPPAPEAMPYRLLITNDGSPASEAVLRALAPLLTAGRFEVTLLRVHEHEPGGQDDAAAMAACERELSQARQLLPASLAVTTLVREIPRGAGVDTAIIEKALEVNAQAIAMSTHGISARNHVMMGSVATTTLGRSPLPLLLARSEV